MGIRRLNNHRNYIRDSADRICEVDDGGGGTSKRDISSITPVRNLHNGRVCTVYTYIILYTKYARRQRSETCSK